MTWKQYRKEWIKHNTCKFCRGNDLHTCLLYRCRDAVRKAERYFDNVIKEEEVKRMKRKYVTDLRPWFTEKIKAGNIVTRAWLISDENNTEIIVRFDKVMSKIERSMAIRLIEKRCAEAVINERAKEKSSDFIDMVEEALEKAALREWSIEDEKIIRNGIPYEREGQQANGEISVAVPRK